MAWVCLVAAISFGVAGTISLRLASESKKTWWAGVVAGYVIAYSLLITSLSNGMALSVAYGIWAACSVALTAILSRLLFQDRFTWLMGVGLVLIVGGVLLIELGAAH